MKVSNFVEFKSQNFERKKYKKSKLSKGENGKLFLPFEVETVIISYTTFFSKLSMVIAKSI